MPDQAAPVGDLRAQIRSWRRGRGTLRTIDLLQDAYVAVFSAVVIAAMVGSVVVHLRGLLDASCDTDCAAARAALPGLGALTALASVLTIARLLGPVVLAPPADSWLMPTPVDRRALLRPRWLGVCAAALITVPVEAVVAAFGTADPWVAVVWVIATAALALAGVSLAALAQTGDRPPGWLGAVQWVTLGVLWLALASVDLWSRARLTVGPTAAAALVVGTVAVALAAVALLVRVDRRLMRIRRTASGSGLAAGLFGALSGLDLALVQDMLLARYWRGRGVVRSSRRWPSGTMALVAADLRRLLRTPATVGPVLALVVPWSAAGLGAGSLVVPIAAAALFVAALPLATGLRVLTRTPALARMLPMRETTLRAAGLVLPAMILVTCGLAVAGIVLVRTSGPPGRGILLGLVVGLTAVAALVRWVCANPPDYARPMVSTPAGAVPTNLYGSALRGFDVVAVLSIPVLLTDRAVGAWVSLALAALATAALLAPRPRHAFAAPPAQPGRAR